MALTHVTATRDAMANACVDRIDLGSADGTGDLMIMTSGDAEVSIHAATNPAFGASSSGTATAAAIGDDTSAVGGTAALFKFQDRDNGEVFRGTVTATSGGGDIELDSVTVSAGVTVSITSFTYSASV